MKPCPERVVIYILTNFAKSFLGILGSLQLRHASQRDALGADQRSAVVSTVLARKDGRLSLSAGLGAVVRRVDAGLSARAERQRQRQRVGGGVCGGADDAGRFAGLARCRRTRAGA